MLAMCSAQSKNVYSYSPAVSNQPKLVIPSGSVTNLTYQSLPINYSPDEKCIVYVKQNDKLTRKFGHLSKTVFDCEDLSSVRFHHYGAKFPEMALIKLRVQYENRAGRSVLPAALLVEVADPKLRVVSIPNRRSSRLSVNGLNEMSITISMTHINPKSNP